MPRAFSATCCSSAAGLFVFVLLFVQVGGLSLCDWCRYHHLKIKQSSATWSSSSSGNIRFHPRGARANAPFALIYLRPPLRCVQTQCAPLPLAASAGHASSCRTHLWPNLQPGVRPPPSLLFKLASVGVGGDEVRIKRVLLIQRLLMDPPDGHHPTPS